MAVASMGAFGAYKLKYNRYSNEFKEKEKKSTEPVDELVWVSRRYTPLDLRFTAPVPRHKLMVTELPTNIGRHWIPVTEPPLRSFERPQQDFIFASFPSTRCEDWSTLRQMLPSRGSIYKLRPPNWGTGHPTPLEMMERAPSRLPKVNSPMSRFVSHAYTSDRLFKLY